VSREVGNRAGTSRHHLRDEESDQVASTP
jgi:hypothetical protein